MTLTSIMNLLLVAFAFGFVIFWHELGHFLAARWAGVRVEQFAVGMGQALVSWRKGIGLRVGNTQTEFHKRVSTEYARRVADGMSTPNAAQTGPTLREQYDIARDLGLGETEYRFNWIPLGGYVKPTGQDDLRPAAEVGADDPHAFGAKPVSKRMVIISAGVIMNLILAFALYIVLFFVGFNAPPAVIGAVLPDSPAQAAGLAVNDKVLSINGSTQQDFTKLTMNVALLRDDAQARFVVERDGKVLPPIDVQPRKTPQTHNMPAIGVTPAVAMTAEQATAPGVDQMRSPEYDAMPPGSRVVSVNGEATGEDDYATLDAAVQSSDGQLVTIGIQKADGSTAELEFLPTLVQSGFGDDRQSVVGMLPRIMLAGVLTGSPADQAGVQPGDAVAQMAVVETGEAVLDPSFDLFLDWTNRTGQAGHKLNLRLVRDGEPVPPIVVDPNKTIEKTRKGIGVRPGLDMATPVIGAVLPDTPAAVAGLVVGDRITAVDGEAVKNWIDVIARLRSHKPGTVDLTVANTNGERAVPVPLSADSIKSLTHLRFTHMLPLDQRLELRKTHSLPVAVGWAWGEMKFAVPHVYVTLRRLIEGSVPLKNLSGPVGIFSAGSSAAARGPDWLIWFTALISANLAVVNFLPIPIVDGGLFVFLLMEKITGRPPSPRVQTAAQVCGLLLLGSLFLFVTYHDILRQWG